MSRDFSMVQRVRFGDLDAMQHMNNVEFLRFFETARIDWFSEALPGHVPGSRGDFGFIFAGPRASRESPTSPTGRPRSSTTRSAPGSGRAR